MLHSDVTYFWDWFVFGMAIWLLVGFIAAWFSKPVRAQIVRVCVVSGLLSTLLPTQFPTLWRIFYGQPVSLNDGHAVELTMQVAVGALIAFALLLFMLGYVAAVLAERAVRYALDRGLPRRVRDLMHLYSHEDAVE
jgi:hypothetical protein